MSNKTLAKRLRKRHWTYQRIGDKLGVSRQRAHQLVNDIKPSKATKRHYEATHPEQVKASSKRYREKHREQLREYDRQRYARMNENGK